MSEAAVRWFCRNLPSLLDLTDGQPKRSEVDALLALFRQNREIPEPLVVELARWMGEDPGAGTRGWGPGWGLPGVAGGDPARIAYHCPSPTRCDRAEQREPSGPLPWCHLKATAMQARASRHG